MSWTHDNHRHGGGRFYCPGYQHFRSLTENTIFEGSRTPLNVSYRILFHHYINNDSITYAANTCQVNWRTV